jgi:hypothetical protein
MNRPSERTAESARTQRKDLADKAVRAPERWFKLPMRISENVEALHEPSGVVDSIPGRRRTR